MDTLSIAKVSKEAPAAAPPRDSDRETLIDSTQFLRHCERTYGMKPVVAVQGTSHRDASTVSERTGRHLVAAAKSTGVGFALLNSHYKDRRAHIGICLVRPGTDDMLIVDSLPVQRWKGFVPVLESFEARLPEAASVKTGLSDWKPSAATMRAVAGTVARQGYLANATLHPTAESLFDDYDGDMLGFAFHMIAKMKAGRLPSDQPGTRRVRAIRRPDTLFHAGMVTFDIAKEKAREMGKISARCSFWLHDARLVRP